MPLDRADGTQKKGSLTIQCDELWSFVDNKGNKQWVWLALDADTREFEIVVWRALTNAPPLNELLPSLLKFLMPLYGEDPTIPTTLDEQISKLMQYLRSRRCLLILDNAETILQREPVGQWISGYEGYGQLLRAIGEASHQSSLLLTSREKPREMALMEGA